MNQDRLTQLENIRDWQGLVEELDQRLTDTAASNTDKAGYHLRLGRTLLDKFFAGVKALKHFQDAYKLNPQLTESLDAAREVYWDLGKLNMVQKLLELQLKTLLPGERSAMLLCELGDVLSDAGDYDKATSTYARSLSASGGASLSARECLEDVQAESGSWKSRVDSLRELAGATDGDERARLLMRSARIVRRFAPEELAAVLEQAYRANPLSREAAASFEGLMGEAGKLDALEAIQVEAIAALPERHRKAALSRMFALRWLLRHQQVEAALRFLEIALKLDSSHEGPFLYLRDAYGKKSGDWEKVATLAEEAASGSSDDAVSGFYAAQAGFVIWKQLGNLIRARQAFERVAKLAPENPDLHAFETQIGESLRGGERDGSTAVPPPGVMDPATHGGAISVAQTAPPPPVEIPVDIDGVDGATGTATAMPIVRQASPASIIPASIIPGNFATPSTPEVATTIAPLGAPGQFDTAVAAVSVALAPAVAPAASVAPAEAAVPAAAQEAGSDAQIATLKAQAEKQETAKRYNEYVKTLLLLAAAVPDVTEKVEYYTKAADLYVGKFANQAEAVKAYEQVLALEPDNQTAVAYLRQMYEKRRDWEKLIALERREADGLGGAARAQKFLEIAKLATEKVKKPEVCIDLWNEVLLADDANVDALGNLSQLYERSKEFEKLAEVLEKQSEVTYEDAARIQILTKLGTIYGDRLNNDDGAVTAWRTLLTLDPNDRKAQEALKKKYLALSKWDELEVFYAESGKWDEFIRVLEQQEAKETASDVKIGLLFKIAELWSDKKQNAARAAKAYEKVLELDPSNLRAAEALIPIYSAAGNAKLLSGAIEVKLAHEENADEKTSLLREVAALYETKVKDPEKAFDRFLAAFEGAPSDPRSQEDAERSARPVTGWERLIAAYEKAIADAGLDAALAIDLRLRLGRILTDEVARVDAAIAVYRAVYETDGDNADALGALERLYRQTGRFGDLLEVYERKRDLAPDADAKRKLNYEIATLLEVELKNVERALETYAAVLEEQPQDAHALAAQDRLYGQLERWEPYVDTLRRRIELDLPENELIDLKYRLGKTLEAHLSDAAGALENYREILFLDAAHAEAREALEALLTHEELRADAAGILESIYEERGDHAKLVVALEILSASEADPKRKVQLERKIARVASESLGDQNRAFAALSKAVKDDPELRETRDEIELTAERAQKWAELAGLYAEIAESLASTELAREYWMRIASVQDEHLKSPDEASKAYLRVLALEPSDEEALTRLEELYTRTQRWTDLVGVAERRIEQTENSEERETLFIRIARIYDERLAQPEEAVKAYRRVLELDPTSMRAHGALDALFLRQKQWPELAETLEAQLALTTEDASQIQLMLRLASLREVEMGQLEQAIEGYRQVLERDVSNADGLVALERLGQREDHELAIADLLEPHYRKLGNHPKLIAVHDVQVRKSDDVLRRVELLHQIAELHEDAGQDANSAFTTLSRALREDPASELTQSRIDRVARATGRFADLAHVYETLGNDVSKKADAEPALTSSLFMMGARLHEEDLGNIDKAIELYNTVLVHDASSLIAVQSLERLYRGTERYAELSLALQRKSEIVDEPAEKKDALFKAAAIEEEVLEKPEAAIAVYKKVLELDPDDFGALDALIRRYLGLSRWTDLLGVYARKVDLVADPDEKKRIYYQVGAVYERELSNVPEAIETYNKILELDPDDLQALSRLDVLYEQAQNWQELLTVLTRESEMTTDSREAVSFHYRIAELHEKRLNDVSRSVELYRDILTEQADHEPTLAALERLKSGGEESLAAAAVLEPVYEASGEWALLAAVHEVQVARAEDAFQKVDLYHRIARLQEDALSLPIDAFSTYARALTVDNANDASLHNLERLALGHNLWSKVAELYDAELDKLTEAPERFVDLGLRTAQVYEVQLSDTEHAIARYTRVLEIDAVNAVALRSLDRLYLQTKRYRELATILAREAEATANADEQLALKHRLGLVQEQQLQNIDAAIASYREVVEANPDYTVTREALERLFAAGIKQVEIGSVLDPIYTNAGEFEKLAGVYEAHLTHTLEKEERLQRHYAIAALYEEKLGDLDRTLQAGIRTLKEYPLDERTGEEVVRLAPSVHEGFETLANAYADILGLHEDVAVQKTVGLRLARTFEDDLGDITKAEETYAYVLGVDGTDEEALSNLDRIHTSMQAWEELAKILEMRVRVPHDPAALTELYARMGEVYELRLGNIPQAIVAYRRIFDELEPNHEGAVVALARIYEGQSNWRELNGVYERELASAHGDSVQADIRAKIAHLASTHLGEPGRAIETWKTVLDLRGEDPEALAALANLYEAQQNWRELTLILERQADIAESDDDRVNIFTRRARTFTDRLGQDDIALEDWNRVLDLDVTNRAALRSIAAIRRRQDDPNELVNALHMTVERGAHLLEADELREVYRELGKTYSERLEQPYDAAEAWRKLLELGPDFEAFNALERIYQADERTTDVIDVKMQRAAALPDAATQVAEYREAAQLWTASTDNPDGATAPWQKILDVDPTSDEAYVELEKLHIAADRNEPLVELYLNRLDTREEVAEKTDLLRKIAKVFETKLEDKNQALDALVNALEIDRHDRETARYLERLAHETRRWTEVLATVNGWLKAEQNPRETVQLCLLLAKWYGDDNNRPDYAQPLYARIVQLDPNNVGALRQMGQLYRKSGNLAQYGATLTRALDVAQTEVDQKEILVELGELLDSQMNQTDQAITYFQRALKVDTHYIPALENLERIFAGRGQNRELVDVLQKKVPGLDSKTEIASTKLRIGSLFELSDPDRSKAAQVYREVLEIDAENLQALRGLARVYDALEQWTDLVRTLESELDVVPTERERIDILMQLASLQEEKFVKPDIAAARLEQVLEIDPNHEDAYFALARNYRKLRQWTELINTYERHIATTTDRSTKVELYGLIAQVQQDELHDLERAVDAYRNIVDVEETHVPALDALAKLYDKQGDAVQAVEFMTRVAELTQDNKQRVEAYARIGKMLDEKLGDRVAAQDKYELAVDLDPGHLPSLAALKQIALDNADYDKAARYIDQEQSYTTVGRQRARLLVELGRIREDMLQDHDSAVMAWEAAVEADSENEDAALPLADEFIATEQWERAEPLLELLTRKASKRERAEQHELNQKLGRVASALGKDERALKAYMAAHQLDLTNQDTIRGLAEVSFRLKDWAGALTNYQKVLTALGEDESEARADVYYRLGSIKREQGQAKQAIVNYEKALGVQSNHRLTLDALVSIYTELKDWKQVVSYKRQILDDLVDGDIRFALLLEIGGTWAEQDKNVAKAIEAYEEARDLRPSDLPLLNKLLLLYPQAENWPKMIDTLQALAELEKDSVRKSKFVFTIAQLYRDKENDQERAVELFNEALDLNPNYLEAFERINKILTTQKDWKSLERAFRKMLRRLSTANVSNPDLEWNLWHNLGLIYRDRLTDPNSAIEAFKMATRFKPDELLERQILAELYEGTDQIEAAMTEHWVVLQKDPMKVDAYRALYRLALKAHDYDRAWTLCAALAFLQKADEDERRFFDDYRPKGMVQVRSRLDNEQWVRNLFHKDENLFIGKIFEMVTPAAITARIAQLQRAKQLPVLPAQFKQDPMKSTITFAKTFGWAAQVLGVPQPDLYVRNDVAGALVAVVMSPPASVAGQTVLTGFSPQELTFIVGKHLSSYRGEHYIKTLFPTLDDLKVVLFAGIKLIIPDFALPPQMAPAVEGLAREFQQTMRPVERESLRIVVQKFVEDGAKADLKRWMQTVEVTAARAGLLLCGDLEIARKIIAAEPQLPGDLSPPEKMKELLVFSVSEQYLQLRKALGIAVGQEG